MKKYISVLCTLFLIGCGGGGTSPSIGLEPIGGSSPPPPPTPLFNSEPLVIQDTESLYSSVCVDPHNYRPSIQFVIPVTLNDDDYTDFFVVYWLSLIHI